MTHIPKFVKPVKMSWLRRAVMLELSNVDFKQLLSVGGQYAESLINQLTNPFWKDLLGHWAFFFL